MDAPVLHNARRLEVCLLSHDMSIRQGVERDISAYQGAYTGHLVCANNSTELMVLFEATSFDLLMVHVDALDSASEVLELLYSYGQSSPQGHVLYFSDSETSRPVYPAVFGGMLRACPVPHEERALFGIFDEIVRQMDSMTSMPLLVHTRGSTKALHPDAIVYVESDRRVLYIHLKDEVVRIYGKLSDLLLKLPSHFVHCHKSFLVNMEYIDELTATHVLTVTGETVPVSQKKRNQTQEAYDSYMQRGYRARA